MQTGKFNIMVDSAWGSSGKGAASTRLADIHNVPCLSSCNYPNAGHTVVIDGKKFVFKVVPSGAALRASATRNKKPTIWIGPGTGFDIDVLLDELSKVSATHLASLFIHERAVQVTDSHRLAEMPGGSQSTLHISSTMSGSGAAFSAKAMRGVDVKLARDHFGVLPAWSFYRAVQNNLQSGNTFLHEVSQGFALSIDYGTHYPSCTFRNCTPQQGCADFGIKPNQVGDVYLNVRSFPIRVGNNYDDSGKQIGYSGDCLPDHEETTWEQVAKDAGFPPHEAAELAERERTTVTKKIRRVFTPSWELLKMSADFTGATKMVLNFPQYIHWSVYKMRGGKTEYHGVHPSVRAYVDKMQEVTNLPVTMIGTGPDHDDFLYLD